MLAIKIMRLDTMDSFRRQTSMLPALLPAFPEIEPMLALRISLCSFYGHIVPFRLCRVNDAAKKRTPCAARPSHSRGETRSFAARRFAAVASPPSRPLARQAASCLGVMRRFLFCSLQVAQRQLSGE